MAVNRKKSVRVGMLVHSQYLKDARVRRQAECLAEIGYEVHVVSCQKKDRHGVCLPTREIVNNVHIHRLALIKKRGNILRYFYEYAFMMIVGMSKLIRLSLRKKFDVIHIHNMPDLLVMAGLLFKWKGIPLILDIHDPVSELYQENYHLNESHRMIRALTLVERFCYRLASHLITVSRTMAENVAKKSGRHEDDIMVLHNFPDLRIFKIRDELKEWPYNKNSFILLYSGTVTEHYRLDIAVKAIAIASRTLPNIKLQILGEGNRLKQILDLAATLGISKQIELLDPVDLDDVKDVLAKADVGVSTHQSGAFGKLCLSTKIIEFMTQRLPVISSRIYTISQYIPEDSIFYFEPGQPEDLAKQIIFMYKNPDIVMKKINNSQKLLSQYTWQREKDKLASFYQKISHSTSVHSMMNE